MWYVRLNSTIILRTYGFTYLDQRCRSTLWSGYKHIHSKYIFTAGEKVRGKGTWWVVLRTKQPHIFSCTNCIPISDVGSFQYREQLIIRFDYERKASKGFSDIWMYPVVEPVTWPSEKHTHLTTKRLTLPTWVIQNSIRSAPSTFPVSGHIVYHKKYLVPWMVVDQGFWFVSWCVFICRALIYIRMGIWCHGF